MLREALVCIVFSNGAHDGRLHGKGEADMMMPRPVIYCQESLLSLQGNLRLGGTIVYSYSFLWSP